jgi:hypothetical protein
MLDALKRSSAREPRFWAVPMAKDETLSSSKTKQITIRQRKREKSSQYLSYFRNYLNT